MSIRHYTFDQWYALHKDEYEDEIEECDVCLGSGQHYCDDCGAKHDCDPCDGTGKINYGGKQQAKIDYDTLVKQEESRLKRWVGANAEQVKQ
jgi:hypothetical protein